MQYGTLESHEMRATVAKALQSINVAIIGSSGVGKTSLINLLCNGAAAGRDSDRCPTEADETSVVTRVIDGAEIVIKIGDTVGASAEQHAMSLTLERAQVTPPAAPATTLAAPAPDPYTSTGSLGAGVAESTGAGDAGSILYRSVLAYDLLSPAATGLKGVQGVLVVFDLTKRPTYEEALRYARLLYTRMGYDPAARAETDSGGASLNTALLAKALVAPIPVILVGNKADLVSRREVPESEVRQACDKFRLPYFETSVKRNLRVDETFRYLVSQVRKSAEDAATSAAAKQREQDVRRGCCTII